MKPKKLFKSMFKPLLLAVMALVGWTTEARTRKRWLVQTRLAGHFADLVAGLPTLQVFVGGEVVKQFQGGKTKAMLIRALEEYL